MKLTTITGLLLIIVPIAFNATFILLGSAYWASPDKVDTKNVHIQ